VYDDEGYYVNEVNVVPEFKALVKTTGANIARIIVDHIVREVRS
jgi:glutathione synthase/RimK-type ligase-like ATP-grasp enzyme